MSMTGVTNMPSIRSANLRQFGFASRHLLLMSLFNDMQSPCGAAPMEHYLKSIMPTVLEVATRPG